ncbi:MAG: helix-turn-helix domain-containing protein [Actinomycetota bacterium]|nr:helix-turn-helix domain-containing protein [Actinomycetota bacterium]
MTRDELMRLPIALDTATAADLYDVSPDHLWKLAREGRAPVEPLHLGRALRWPRASVLRSLGIDASDGLTDGDE